MSSGIGTYGLVLVDFLFCFVFVISSTLASTIHWIASILLCVQTDTILVDYCLPFEGNLFVAERAKRKLERT